MAKVRRDDWFGNVFVAGLIGFFENSTDIEGNTKEPLDQNLIDWEGDGAFHKRYR